MKKQLLTGAVAFGTVAIGSTLFVRNANAFTLNGTTYSLKACNNTVKTFVSDTSDCQYVNPQTNQLNDQNNNFVNGLGFFGHTDWIKSTNYFDNVEDKEGTFKFSNINFDLTNKSNVLLVLKGGNQTTLVGYLLDLVNTDGEFTWEQPWEELYGKAKNVSHISLYYKESATEVPTPALLPGLIGMGMASLRKKKKQVGENA